MQTREKTRGEVLWIGGDNAPAPIADSRLSPPRDYNAAAYFVDRHLAEGRGGKLAYIDDRGAYSFAELAARTNRAGNLLRGLGIRAGDRVMMCVLDGIDFPALFWGAIKLGAVPVPISTMLTSADYDYLLRDSGARALALSRELLDRFRPVIDSQPNLESVLVSGALRREPLGAAHHLDALAERADSRLECAPTVSDAPAFWLYTSGSTGKPKGAVHLHRDLIQTAVLNGEMTLGIGADDVILSGAKLFFAYGLGNAITFPLHAGATAVLMAERSSAEAVMETMRRRRPTVFFGVPTLFGNILANPDFDRRTGSDRLRLCVSAGEPLPESISQRWKQRFGVEIIDGIGSTEALHVFISNRPGDIRYGTSGKPVPGWELRLLDESGREVDDGEAGDLWVSGPSISAMYWNNREMSIRNFVGRWLRTGDKYERDPDGYYRYVGRSDDMLKASGMWVSPFEVESVLIAHPDVVQAAVVGVPDREGLIKPMGFVVLRDGVAPDAETAEALRVFAREHLAHFKCPRSIEFRTELPMTATGKIQRYKLRAEAVAAAQSAR